MLLLLLGRRFGTLGKQTVQRVNVLFMLYFVSLHVQRVQIIIQTLPQVTK